MPQISSGDSTIDARFNDLMLRGCDFVLFSLPFRLNFKFVAEVAIRQSGAWYVYEGVAELSRPFALRVAIRLAIDAGGRYELRLVLPSLDAVLAAEVLPRLAAGPRAVYDKLVRPYVPFYRDCDVILSSHAGEDATLGGILAGINFYVGAALGELEPTRQLCRAFPAAGLDKRRMILHLGCIASPAFTFVVEGSLVTDAALGTPAIVLDKLALRVDQDSSSLMASASVYFTVHAGGEALVFIGAIGLDSKGMAMISGSLDAADGAWKDPFGARGVTLTGVGSQVMVAPEAPFVGLGLRAGVRLGQDKLAAKVALLFDPGSPDKSVLQIESDRPIDLQRMLTSVVDPKYVPADLLRITIDDFAIYISPNGGIIAGKEYSPGFALRGAIDLWGFRAAVDGSLTYASGGSLRGSFSPLRFPDDGLLVDIHGDPGRGPSLDLAFNAVSQGGRAVGAVKIVGLYNHAFEAVVSADRLLVALGKTQLGIYTGGSLELAQSRLRLTCEVGFHAHFDVDLAGQRIRLDTDVTASYAAEATVSSLSQPVRFAFDACGAKLDFDTNAGKLLFTDAASMARFFESQGARISQEILEAIGTGSLVALEWLRGVLPDPSQATLVMRHANVAAGQAATALRQLYGATAEQAGTLMRMAAYSPQAIAGALKSAYTLTEKQVGVLLDTINMSPNDIAKAMRKAFDWSADETATFFKDTLDYSDQTAKKALEAAGYSATQVKEAMIDVYDWTESLWDQFIGLF